MKNNYFIIHGFKGSNIENWFPWFKENVDDDNNLCTIPQFPIENKYHNYECWKKLLDVYKECEMFNRNTTMIGHSTGSICALKYILDSKLKIKKLILVSGFNNFYAEDSNDIHNVINPTYYVNEKKIEEIKNYVNEIICVFSDNDPYIPQSALHSLAERTGAKKVIVPGGGHLNAEAGYRKFEELLKYI